MRDKDVVAILCAAGTYGDETAGLHDFVEGGTVHHQVLDYRESTTAPRLHGDGCTGFEVTHEQLTRGYLVVRTVCTAVHIQGTGTADTLTAVVIKGDGLNALADELIVQDIQHFEERSIFLHIRNVVGLEMAFCFGVLLTPYFNIIFHTRD